jgi:hypothetical protein
MGKFQDILGGRGGGGSAEIFFKKLCEGGFNGFNWFPLLSI